MGRINEDKEQEFLKKLHETAVKIEYIILNLLVIIMCLVSGGGFINYLIKPERTLDDNKQMFICGFMHLVFLFLLWLDNRHGAFIFSKFLSGAAEVKKRRNKKEKKSITDLNAAMHAMSQKNGVVMWDTLWSVPAIVFILCMFVKGGNKPVILGFLIFSLVMLFGGHYIGVKIWMRRCYEKKILKYTKRYFDIADEEEYVMSVDESIQRGILGYSGLWMLTDEYIIGRLSDIRFEAAAIPRELVIQYMFFYYRKIASENIPEGVLRCQLKNGKSVDFVIGRGENCDHVLKILSEQRIPWTMNEMKYG